MDIDGSAEDDILPQSLKNGTIDWIKPGLFITAPRVPYTLCVCVCVCVCVFDSVCRVYRHQ